MSELYVNGSHRSSGQFQSEDSRPGPWRRGTMVPLMPRPMSGICECMSSSLSGTDADDMGSGDDGSLFSCCCCCCWKDEGGEGEEQEQEQEQDG